MTALHRDEAFILPVSFFVLLTLCWLMLGTALRADAPSSPKGVIILTSASGLDPRNVSFSDLAWTDFYGGTVIDSNGQKSVFAKKDIGKIIYFDSDYYTQVDNDQQEKAFRAGIEAREIVVNTAFLNLDATNDLKSVQSGEAALEFVVHEYPTIQSLVQPQIDLLKDDIGKLSSGQSLLNGKWMSQQEAATQATPKVVGEINKPVSFTTKDGKKYVNATVSITNTGLSVLTSNGGASVSFDKLPDDLSPFSKSIQLQIAKNRQAVAVTATVNTPPALTLPREATAEQTSDNVPPRQDYANLYTISTKRYKVVLFDYNDFEYIVKAVNQRYNSSDRAGNDFDALVICLDLYCSGEAINPPAIEYTDAWDGTSAVIIPEHDSSNDILLVLNKTSDDDSRIKLNIRLLVPRNSGVYDINKNSFWGASNMQEIRDFISLFPNTRY